MVSTMGISLNSRPLAAASPSAVLLLAYWRHYAAPFGVARQILEAAARAESAKYGAPSPLCALRSSTLQLFNSSTLLTESVERDDGRDLFLCHFLEAVEKR